MAEPTSATNRIFISYRRDDSAAITGRIYDRLVKYFGEDAVFKDVDAIPLGVNFKEQIESVVKACDVALIIIGSQWFSLTSDGGQRKIDHPHDFVRLEIEAALQRSIPVIPLLVNNAHMPDESQLPTSVSSLAYRNGMTVGHDPHFHTDVDRLIKGLEYLVRGAPGQRADLIGTDLLAKSPETETQSSGSSERHSSARRTLRAKIDEMIAKLPDQSDAKK